MHEWKQDLCTDKGSIGMYNVYIYIYIYVCVCVCIYISKASIVQCVCLINMYI